MQNDCYNNDDDIKIYFYFGGSVNKYLKKQVLSHFVFSDKVPGFDLTGPHLQTRSCFCVRSTGVRRQP